VKNLSAALRVAFAAGCATQLQRTKNGDFYVKPSSLSSAMARTACRQMSKEMNVVLIDGMTSLAFGL
jgi:hypothetical protein